MGINWESKQIEKDILCTVVRSLSPIQCVYLEYGALWKSGKSKEKGYNAQHGVAIHDDY